MQEIPSLFFFTAIILLRRLMGLVAAAIWIHQMIEARGLELMIMISGSVGVTEEEPRSSLGKKKKIHAQFGQKRTHNEQVLVRPCGMIYARATMFGAEAVSNFLVMIKKAFSVPGARKPDFVIYDTNCDARQQADNDPWFNTVAMPVDVWHFKNKHKATHEYCQWYCNPASFPQLLDKDGRKWYFNTSVCEQTNAWLGRYYAIVREMTPVKYDFFLNEMCRLRNVDTLAKLVDAGDDPCLRLPSL
ncbi:hypothetical protein NP233_g12463 [Leucocoprinus birnbaumii]|uniref:Uncharacterized protein n=1 Tax=Leucocoprinus birnbaumii TaxID=56174 RepID=A0AAD5VFM5_9AGAR|nr:hypothetical protein NP233_g12463 [Leucocoprinus birnbaumii]